MPRFARHVFRRNHTSLSASVNGLRESRLFFGTLDRRFASGAHKRLLKGCDNDDADDNDDDLW